MSFSGVPPIFSVNTKAHLSLPHLISCFNESTSLLDFDSVHFLNCSDAQTPPMEEYRVYTAVDPSLDKTFSQYQLDLAELEYKTIEYLPSWDPEAKEYAIKSYSPTHKAPRGILVSEYNLNQWVEGCTTESNVGFAYNGRVKCSFSIPYDYLITSPVTLGDEVVSLPFTIRVFRRDPFLTLWEIRLFIQHNCRFYLPPRYCDGKEPFTLSRFKAYCKPFKVDEEGALVHKGTGFKVVMGSATAMYEQGICHFYNLYGSFWHHFTADRLNDMVMKHLERWFVDGELLAAYWLERLSGGAVVV
ncbi:hypothetical protein PQX77_018349 [Marasmius sp. AFHP31]|nr:hypothetical protein PQX77_018349 [Marasmius sp. AFHP31]